MSGSEKFIAAVFCAFPIPMRGNETFSGGSCPVNCRDVPDPHEG